MSGRSRGNRSRQNSVASSLHFQRAASYRKKIISGNESYVWALRVAYLAYLLQPRQKRVQHVSTATPQQAKKSSTSSMDLLNDFKLVRDSKSTKLPRGFMEELDKRMSGVLQGRERMPEFNDSLVKVTFGAFLNAFKEPAFRKSVDKDRRMEDLLLIFFSNATKELQKKLPDNDGWKLMVDRHVALFIRLISSILKDHDWNKDKPELATRLQTMEKKLLLHDQDLASNGSKAVEVEVPRSYEVRDMPLVMAVQRIFGKTYDDVQADIVAYRPIWTEREALQDLKKYQAYLSLDMPIKRTLTSDDFDSEEAYEAWRKTEIPDISQMMLAIIQSNMELAKESSTGLPQFHAVNASAPSGGGSSDDSSMYSELSRRMSGSDNNSYVIDQPMDTSAGGSAENPFGNGTGFHERPSDEEPYVYIPSDPRAYYRAVLKVVLLHDLRDPELQSTGATTDSPAIKLISEQSAELLSEVALRWRVPQFSRRVLFLDVIRELYQHEEITIETLDAAFLYIKEPINKASNKKSFRSSVLLTQMQDQLYDWNKWTVTDFALHNSTYAAIRDCLLRDLFNLVLGCYDTKAPNIGPVVYILHEHIEDDPSSSHSAEPSAHYKEELQNALSEKARDVYVELYKQHIPRDAGECEFYHIIELGKAVGKLCEKIQKRYRKNPEIMGVDPLATLVAEVLPAFAEDARNLVTQVIQIAASKDEQISIQDGFDLYRELSDAKAVHAAALPNMPFGFNIEDQLQDFVWRFIRDAETKITAWVEEAVKMDDFHVRTMTEEQIATDDERHSMSVIDIFRSFNQSIDQLQSLRWDNEIHYAKFMTAIAKGVSMGICKYAELLESRFIREMEKLTPEQEAAKGMSRQQKLLQMAQDAWSNKEKIEPFQFSAESLVKLNNIEWATLQLDELSRSVNSDACAEIIERNTPAQMLQQRMRQKDNKFVFTIKIIEGEDLKACDMNGLSDPYVVLGDEFHKRLAKTRTVYSSLNPRWDESVDITTSGPLNIIATVWDYDTLGEHDCMGRTSLKLDPSHFRDYVPREYWLDLDTQGRVLLRVSMEGERDDIRFWYGKGMRGLKRCEREMTRGIVDKLSAYIHHVLSRKALQRLVGLGYKERVGAVASWFTSRTTQARTSIQFNLTSPVGATPPARPELTSNKSMSKQTTQAEVAAALRPLFTYFDENFAIMKETLTETAMIAVMTRIWKEVLVTIEGLLVPPLSDKPSTQKPLTRIESDIVFQWLEVRVTSCLNLCLRLTKCAAPLSVLPCSR